MQSFSPVTEEIRFQSLWAPKALNAGSKQSNVYWLLALGCTIAVVVYLLNKQNEKNNTIAGYDDIENTKSI